MATGNNDMANGNGFVNEEARFAALSQRVTGIESSVNNLSSQFSAFVAKLDERGRTPWGLLVSVAIAILAYVTTIGGLAYAPVWSAISRIENSASGNLSDVKGALTTITERMVTQKEIEARAVRGAEDRQRMEASVKEVRDAQVPRAELERVWHSQDQTDAQLQKQIDEIKANAAATYTPRDAMLDMREKVDRLERQRLSPAN